VFKTRKDKERFLEEMRRLAEEAKRRAGKK
jgi:hypothetical protein